MAYLSRQAIRAKVIKHAGVRRGATRDTCVEVLAHFCVLGQFARRDCVEVMQGKVSQDTVDRALQRLEHRGFIKYSDEDADYGGTLYLLRDVELWGKPESGVESDRMARARYTGQSSEV